nr:nucleotidyltransferase [Paraburkholderia azotifigens]
MRLVDQFKTFLDEEVNLNKTRIDLLTTSVDAVKTAIKGSDWSPRILSFAAHGSWDHGTIIKPVSGDEFDADLLVIVESVAGWEAKDYVNKLGGMFDAHHIYKDKVRRYSHCVTIEYAGDRRIDIAPCVKGRLFPDTYEVCNRISNAFETSAPLAYTDWVTGRNAIAGGNDLKKVTRLLKYLRDIKSNFTCPSFLFTTLVGSLIYDTDKDSAAFADTPTCLKTVMGRLDDWLQWHQSVPTVLNPVLSSEVQSRVWDQTRYSNFRDKINLYRGWIDDAYDETDRDESIGKWQRVFGDEFAASEAKESSRISESVVAGSNTVALFGQFRDLVDLIRQKGRAALPARITRLPYVRRPKWRSATQQLTVKITADLLTSTRGRIFGRSSRSTRCSLVAQSGSPRRTTSVRLFRAATRSNGESQTPTEKLTMRTRCEVISIPATQVFRGRKVCPIEAFTSLRHFWLEKATEGCTASQNRSMSLSDDPTAHAQEWYLIFARRRETPHVFKVSCRYR